MNRHASPPPQQHLPGELADYLEGLMEGFVLYDVDWRMTYMNAAAEKILGRKREEVLGKSWHAAFPHAVGNPVDLMYQRVMRERVAQGMELYYEHYGRWFELSASPVQAGGIAVYFRDTTERRQAEELFSKAFRASPDGLLISRASDGMIREANESFLQLFGFRREELIGRRTTDVRLFADPADRKRGIQAFQQAGRLRDYELATRTRSGQLRTVLVSVESIELGGELSFLTLVRDITERKRMENALKEADRRKDEFVATLAHELRNPLAPIRSAVEILDLQGSPNPTLQAARDIIARQVQHMVRLIDDLLDISRISRGKLELRRQRVALAAVVEEAIETARPHLGHELTVSLPSEPIELYADRVRLTEVFANLLNNAGKYTAKGGSISLTAERVGAEVVVTVKDTGIGIPPEHVPRLFEMFSQVAPALERSQSGLGIGLALSRGLVEMHGGAIEARSEGIGKGSEFIVRLPVLAEGAVTEPERRAGEGSPPVTGRRILVVDDNSDAASSLATLLRLDANDVQTANDGLEALEKAPDFKPDVILLDIGMPNMNGYETCRALRAQPWAKDVAIIALTGWGQEEDLRKSKEAGFDAHLVKPVDHAGLMRVLAR